MAKTAAERMAELRARQRQAGLATLTIVVPRSEVATFREAARRARRPATRDGRSGAPARLLRNAIAPAARRSAISSRDIRKLRELLEVTAVGLIVERMDPRLGRRLERALALDATLDCDVAPARLQRFHLALAELSGDETLRFLLRIALGVTAERSGFALRPRAERNAVVGRMRRSHARIARALVARDAAAAESAVRRYFAELEDWLE